MTHSLAIIEHLHETTPGSSLLRSDPIRRYRGRQLSNVVAMEIHPVRLLTVANHVVALTNGGDATKHDWMRHFISAGLTALEALLAQIPDGPFCVGSAPTMADCRLAPQLDNAERWGVDCSSH